MCFAHVDHRRRGVVCLLWHACTLSGAGAAPILGFDEAGNYCKALAAVATLLIPEEAAVYLQGDRGFITALEVRWGVGGVWALVDVELQRGRVDTCMWHTRLL